MTVLLRPTRVSNMSNTISAKLEDLSHIHSQLKQIELWFTQNFDDVELPAFLKKMNQYDSLLGARQIENHDVHRRDDDGKDSVF